MTTKERFKRTMRFQPVDRELLSKLPKLLKDGGYLPQIDHLAPPDISYQNWLYYLKAKRRICEGK